MPAQLGLPAALAARGLTVELVPGWETRSAGSFNPRGAVCHWTAGPKGTLKRPSLSICTHGRADLPGPLCNVYLDRRGIAVVVAAGRANHAGAGSWGKATGNSSFFGTECEAAGPDDFTKEQRYAYPRVNAAFCDLGGFGPDMVCGHSEYATPRGRKSDINGYTMTDMRAQVAAVLAGKPATLTDPTPDVKKDEDDDMKPILLTATDNGKSYTYEPTAVTYVGSPGRYKALRKVLGEPVLMTQAEVQELAFEVGERRQRDGLPALKG